MKTTKANYLRTLYTLLFVALLTTSCGQSTHPTTEKERKEKTVAKAPEMDLQTAVITGNLEAVRQHIAAGSDLNEKEPFNGSTPLITAATFGKTEIAKELIGAGANLSIKNSDGSTALHAAAFFGRVEIVQELIDANADKTLLNNYGSTAREIVSGPFAEIKPVYEMMQEQLQPFGLQLDMNELEKTRPVIAMMLQ
jgi:ankyrin repeat protein